MRVSICARKTHIWDPFRAILRWAFVSTARTSTYTHGIGYCIIML